MPANATLYGFVELKDIYSQRISTVNVQTLQTAINESVNEHNRQITELTGSLVMQTTDYKKRYQLPASGSLQPLDERGNPLPTQPSGVYDVAFPIQGGGDAWGVDRVSGAKATIEDLARWTSTIFIRDVDWLRRHILAAIFTNVTWTYTDPQWGSLTIQPLANGDAVIYVRHGGAASTDTHFLAQANAIGAGADNPYPIMYTELAEHPSNTGPYIAYISSSLVATTTALATFDESPDPDIRYSSTTQTLAAAQFNPNDTVYSGNLRHFGDRVLGKDSGMWVVEWSSMPAGYIFFHAAGANDIVGMREHPEAELQGLFPEYHTPDGNLKLNRMIRYAGFGVQNRIGAGVYRIGNASYAIPTGFTAPLAA